ncbi:hypothetical protein PSTG_03868 [Puccinia striiformis f. sp. tritici PST-78]|uniref:Chromo domain-containing protein n=1 Tax=Puccinia striiformis f. sp. tritici PST-78 TaxID=1165861 RepID=A0A0L0VUG0_9BASI|nr:hypothetical protein PSTG_03868 [Puccinia striiformis f. sp. tritici PST-78]
MKGVHPVFHVSVLRKYHPDSIEGRRQEKPDPIEVQGEEEWEVEEALNCRRKGRRRQFLISWKGYAPEENSWEPETNLTNCGKLLKNFQTKFPDAAANYKKTRRFK